MWSPNKTAQKVQSKPATRTVRPIKDCDLLEFGGWVVNHDWKEVIENVMLLKVKMLSMTSRKSVWNFIFQLHVSDKPWISMKTKQSDS